MIFDPVQALGSRGVGEWNSGGGSVAAIPRPKWIPVACIASYSSTMNTSQSEDYRSWV